ncbi:MAG: nickel pincer cofactor biosynthesis protein LarC [Desulfobacteraceae bacterium]|nr:nickel pincer cofactor biosynthesis protein LarC [Desulfobacteraceae bacterium]MBC2754737.1 nickel pincer cofactor biosynthesis protein LarC [Desulfobacteraceae bacterium]
MIAHFDCFAGISGDMTLGAFVDSGVPVDWLEDTLKANLLTDFDLSLTSVSKMGITAKKIDVIVKNNAARDYAIIREMIGRSSLNGAVKDLSLEMFEKLALAESKIHGCRKEHVHFHEVGGVDAIIDVVGTALCVDYLGLKKIFASKIPLGNGFVNCSHGKLPVPAPATIEILINIPVYGTDVPFELVTPTGAAIVSTLAESFGKMPDMLVSKIGYGSGTRDLETIPNLLRIFLGKSLSQSDTVTMIETSIDDMNPEVYGFLMERLFGDGALDVYLVPVFMKKNRPGTLLQVLCHHSKKETLIRRILTETTTLGVRYFDVERRLLEREAVTIETGYGPVSAKKVITPDGRFRIVPEYEVCRAIARKKNIPIRTVYEKISQHAENLNK